MEAEKQIPYIVYESAESRSERTMKRLIIALIISIVLTFVTNAAWLYSWMQYDYVGETTSEETITVDGKDGIANYIGNNGRIVNGESYKNEENDYEEETH